MHENPRISSDVHAENILKENEIKPRGGMDPHHIPKHHIPKHHILVDFEDLLFVG
jgi:hypothetical protein